MSLQLFLFNKLPLSTSPTQLRDLHVTAFKLLSAVSRNNHNFLVTSFRKEPFCTRHGVIDFIVSPQNMNIKKVNNPVHNFRYCCKNFQNLSYITYAILD